MLIYFTFGKTPGVRFFSKRKQNSVFELYDNHANQKAHHRVSLDVVTKWRKDGIDDQRQNKEES
jgi:hypothetical protein